MTSEPSAALADQYGTGRALLAAVTSRAKLDGVDPQRAQREFTQERFLARVFAEADGRWVLKGGTAMIARVRDARTTGDVDLLRREGSMEFVLDELRELCALDVRDHFTFRVGSASPVSTGESQPRVFVQRVSINVECDGRRQNPLRVDLAVGSLMTAAPELGRIGPAVTFPGLAATEVLMYPAVDHVADKVCATASTFAGARSSRVRDLVDLVVLARTQCFGAGALRGAIAAEWIFRGLSGPVVFDPPAAWATRYAREARPVPACAGLTDLVSATAFVSAFLAPVLTDGPDGTWEPEVGEWTDL